MDIINLMLRNLPLMIKQKTKMTALSQEERVPALARLLGGSEITELALANAQEMLDLVK